MSRNITTGIDIGTHYIRVVIGERAGTKKQVLGFGEAPSRGVRHGYIVNPHEAAESIARAIEVAQKQARVRVREAFVALNGIGLEAMPSSGSITISRADAQVTDFDVDNVVKEMEKAFSQKADSKNRRVLHTIPLQFKVDGREVLGRPETMRGMKLEARGLVISCLEQHLNDLILSVEKLGIEVLDVVAAPLAASIVNLTKTQKIAGAVLVNIGAETTSLVVYENNIPISMKVFPVGSTDITNDIALGLQVPLDEAEQMKLGEPADAPAKKLDAIITKRLGSMFKLVEAHLKKIKKNGLLPAGIVLTGGGSGMADINDLAKAALKLPSSVADLSVHIAQNSTLQRPAWSVAYGLCFLGLTDPQPEETGFRAVKKTGSKMRQWFEQFMP